MLTLHPIPAFRDNYIWALMNDAGNCLVVDPGDARPVLTFLHARNARLQAILITHHHPDHIGGLEALLAEYDVPAYGPAHEAIPGVSVKLCDGDDVTLPEPEVHLRVMEVPGHTLGHIAYATVGQEPPLLFCGDTLFAAGCGRLFEGTPAQMQGALDRLAALPDSTRVCCAHEYTLANLRFALAVTPQDVAVQQRLEEVTAMRDAGEPSVPSTLAEERATNPFLRVDQPALRHALEAHTGRTLPDRISRFTALRQWKDTF